MITDQLISERFIHQTVLAGSNKIFDTQQKVVKTYLQPRTGRLHHLVQSRHVSINGTKFTYPMLTYMRFIDIASAHRKSAKANRYGISVYNRVIWGVLYGEVQPQLRFGLTAELKNKIRTSLLASIDTQQTIQFPQ